MNSFSKTAYINPSPQSTRDAPVLFKTNKIKREKKTDAFTYLAEPERHDMYNDQYFLLP